VNRSIQIVFLVLSIGFFVSAAQADEWQYTFAPYLYGAGMDGRVGIAGREVEAEASFSDVLSNLEFGFMAHFEAANEKWIIISDLGYVGLGVATTVPAADLDVNQWVVEGGVGRRINENFEVLFGGRYFRLDEEIRFKGPLGINVQGDQNWFDPFIGARGKIHFSENAALMLRGDIGGFGVGSDFAWTITPSFLYSINEKYSLAFFYKVQSVDREDDDNGFVFDVISSGPGFGMAMHF